MNQNEGLDRYVSPLGAWALSFGCAVGWGAFVMPGTQFLPIAGPIGTTIGLFLGALIMVLLGRNYHYLMQHYQGSGGTFTFTSKVFGYDHGFLSAWFLILTYISIVWANLTALVLIARNVFGDILQFGFHYTLAGYEIYLGEVLFELLVLLLCGLIIAFRKRLAVRIQILFAILRFVGVLVIFVLVLGKVDAETTIKPLFQTNRNPVGQIFNIITLTPWAFIGFESVSHSSREFRFSVKKSFGIMVAAITTGYISYTLLNDLAVLVHPHSFYGWQDYIANLGELNGIAGLPVFNAARESAGNIGLAILSVAVIAGILTGIIGNTIAASRLTFAMSGNGLLPKWFRKQAKDTTPKNAVIFICLVSAVIPFFGRTAIGWIVDVTSIGAVIAYGYTSMGAFKLAGQEKNRHLRITGLIGTLLAVVFGAFLMIPNLISTDALSAESYLILTLWCILGFLFFRYVFKKDEKNRFGRSTVVWVVLLFITFFTALMWMRQETNREIEESMHEINTHYIGVMKDAGMSEGQIPTGDLERYVKKEIEEVGSTLTGTSILQMLLIIIGLTIMISVYLLIMRRNRRSELERIKAEENSRAKSTFLSNMSHDIRTPMNAIVGCVNLSKREDITREELKEYMSKIETASGHLLLLINDVLEMSRIENGRMDLELVGADLRELLREVSDIFATQFSEKNIRFSMNSDGVEHPLVRCDRKRLNRILLNLISNACKFTPGGGEVYVTLREPVSVNNDPNRTGDDQEEDDEKPGNTSWYEIRVRDTGIGMSEEFAAKVFDAFERERTSTVSGIQGTGLGMAITKSIVDHMGGTIEVASKVGEGTEVIVRVPLEWFEEGAEKDTSVRESGEAAQAPDAKPVDLTGKRVLLVEDIDINREIAQMILEQMGLSVETVENGAEAVNRVLGEEAGYYDAVLMDIQMPVMDGYDATRAIRSAEDEQKAKTPIVAMTANAFSEDIRKAHDVGMNGHVAKPIDIAILKNTLEEVLR